MIELSLDNEKRCVVFNYNEDDRDVINELVLSLDHHVQLESLSKKMYVYNLDEVDSR